MATGSFRTGEVCGLMDLFCSMDFKVLKELLGDLQ